MTSRAYLVLAALALTACAAILMAGHRSWDGPVLFGITETHGVNLGDLPVAAVWIAGTAYLGWRWRRP